MSDALDLREAATAIVRRLREAGHEAYFAGGCVRDMLLGREPEDYDVATSARPPQVQRLFDHTKAVGAQFGVALVILEGTPFEVATFRSEGPYLNGRRPSSVAFCEAAEDAQRRDFTINGLFYDPLDDGGKVIDHVGGCEDLKARLVRAVGEPRERFAEDKLRLLRAVRLASQLGFSLEADTCAAVREMAEAVTQVSRERIGDEVIKLLTRANPASGLQMLHDTGLLRVVLPEVERMVGVAQPPEFHPEGDVFTHVKRMLDFLPQQPTRSLALAVLLHDAGKPETFRVAERIRFDSHTKAGARIAARVCRRLRCGRSLTDRVVYLTSNHLRIKDAPQMRPGRLKRFLREPGFPELLELHRLDCLGSHGDLRVYEFCRRQAEELTDEEIHPAPLLTGQDLINMGYEPGPLFGEILGTVEEAQLEGVVDSAEAAQAFVRERWPLGG